MNEIKWINVGYKMPLSEQYVFIFAQADGLGIGYWRYASTSSRKRWYWVYKEVNGSNSAKHVTHWMPLPNPPHKETE